MHFLLPNFIRFVFFWLKDGGNQRAKISLDNNQTPAWANKRKKKTYHSFFIHWGKVIYEIQWSVYMLIHWGKFRNRTINNRISNDILFSLELGKSKKNKNFKLQISHQVSASQRQLVCWYYQFHILLATDAAQKNWRNWHFIVSVSELLACDIERTSVRCWFDNLGLYAFVKWLHCSDFDVTNSAIWQF